MDKNEKIIMAIKREDLFKKDYFEGFKPASEVNFYERLLKDRKLMKRGDAEKNPGYKHPIAYALVINPFMQVFAYQRSQKGGESRLHDKWSWGIGGHIDAEDTETQDPIKTSLLRELKEEVGVENPYLKLLGYINYDSDPVGKVHFGLLFAVRTSLENIKFIDPEIRTGALHDVINIENLCSNGCDVETWSRIALNPLRSYISDTKPL